MKYFTLLLSSLFYVEMVSAQAGLDSSFGINGKLTIPIGDSDDRCYSIGLQGDGKIILAGDYFSDSAWNIAVVRLNVNGKIDSSFGTNGKLTLPLHSRIDFGASLAMGPNDKMIIGHAGIIGDTGFNVTYNIFQLNPNGSLDSSFGNHGMILVANDSGIIGNDLILQSDGKILVGGYQFASNGYGYDFAIERFDSNGVIDKTFGTNGRTLTDGGNYDSSYDDVGESLAIESDSAIFMVGFDDARVLKYHTNGRLDSTFGINGLTPVDSAHSTSAYCIALQADHKILVSGDDFDSNLFLMRYNADGTLDSSFGLNGYVEDLLFASGQSIIVEPDGKIILGGTVGDYFLPETYFYISKWNAGGSADTNFNTYGLITTDFGFQSQYMGKIVLQQDGKILAAGDASNGRNYDFAVARYLNNDIATGVINFSTKKNSVFIYPNPIHESETLQYSLTQDENLSINLYDVSGRLVQSFFSNQKRMQGDDQEELNFNPSLPAGNYVLVISNGKRSASIKVTKQ